MDIDTLRDNVYIGVVYGNVFDYRSGEENL